MAPFSLIDANRMIDAAFAKSKELSLNPLAVAVLDAGGHLIAFQKEDGASMLRFEIARGKAYGALALGVGSSSVARMAIERPHLMQGLSGVSDGRIVPLPGGVLMKQNGVIVGAVGITGDSSENDETCAVFAVEAVGFEPAA